MMEFVMQSDDPSGKLFDRQQFQTLPLCGKFPRRTRIFKDRGYARQTVDSRINQQAQLIEESGFQESSVDLSATLHRERLYFEIGRANV